MKWRHRSSLVRISRLENGQGALRYGALSSTEAKNRLPRGLLLTLPRRLLPFTRGCAFSPEPFQAVGLALS